MTEREINMNEFQLTVSADILKKIEDAGMFDHDEKVKWLEFHKYIIEFPLPADRSKTKITVDWTKLRDKFNEITGKKMRVVSAEVKRKVTARLKEGYKRDEIIKAMTNAIKDPYHIDTSLRYITLEYFSRPKTIDKYQEDLSATVSDKKFEEKEGSYVR